MTQESPPRLLEIYRDFPKPGREAEFRLVEEDAARICAELNYPHAHLAIESLTGPNEVWWLNAFESEADLKQVTEEYEMNSAVVAALGGISKRREGLIGAPVDLMTKYRPDLSRGAPWKLAGVRFFVVTETRESAPAEGSVFEAPDGLLFILRPVATRSQADLAAAANPRARVFAVRPYWGMPAKEWIAADPEFWEPNPMARSR